MAEIFFEDLKFEENKGKLYGVFYRDFCFEIDPGKLLKIGEFNVEGGRLIFPKSSQKGAMNKLKFIIEEGLGKLKSRITGKNALYIHRGSGIPLIGSNSFGIIDRNNSIIEIRPIAGCNHNCNYCSVDEGLSTRKVMDIIVEKDYILEELKKLIEFKECNGIEVHINAQGEPTMYAKLPELVADIKKIKQVKEISLVSNAGATLTEELIDRLAAAGLTRMHLSINALDPRLSKIIAGTGHYDIQHGKEMAEYAAKKIEVIIAPVLIQGFNEKEMIALIEFSKKIGAKIGIQNFLEYKKGRNPATQLPWEKFYELMRGWEEKTGAKLLMDKDDFRITETKKLPKPFRKNQTINGVAVADGRYPKQKIGVAKDRSITIANCDRLGEVRVKLFRTKHNIFMGVAV